MKEKVIIHCDECGSIDVLHEEVVSPPKEIHKTMSEVARPKCNASLEYDVYFYRQFRMVCKNCGHIVKYER